MSRIRPLLPWFNTLVVAALFLALVPLPSRAAESPESPAPEAPPASPDEQGEEGTSPDKLVSLSLMPEWWSNSLTESDLLESSGRSFTEPEVLVSNLESDIFLEEDCAYTGTGMPRGRVVYERCYEFSTAPMV